MDGAKIWDAYNIDAGNGGPTPHLFGGTLGGGGGGTTGKSPVSLTTGYSAWARGMALRFGAIPPNPECLCFD